MQKYLVSYVYEDPRTGIGRVILNLGEIDVEEIENRLQDTLNFNKVMILNIVKISKQKKHKDRPILEVLFEILFPKKYTKLQFKKAKEKEFDC